LMIGAGIYYQDVLLKQNQQWQQENKIESLLSAARNEQPQGDLALNNYKQVLKLQPNNAEAHLGLQFLTNELVSNARGAIKTGDFVAAEEILAEAVTILPDSADIKLATDELAEAIETHKNNLAKEKQMVQQLDAAIKKSQAVADKGQITETFSLIEQARILGADNETIDEVKSRLRIALETQAALETARAKQAMKVKDTKSARQSLKIAKDIKSQLDKLNLPQTDTAGSDKTAVLLNVVKAAAAEGNLGLAMENFRQARSLGASVDDLNAAKEQLIPILEEQAAKAAAEAQQAMKDKDMTTARNLLKKAKRIKVKLKQLQKE
jgi:flagellin-specific chaperone FliS